MACSMGQDYRLWDRGFNGGGGSFVRFYHRQSRAYRSGFYLWAGKRNRASRGFHFKAPWQKVTEMDNRIVKLKVSTAAFISDLQTVTVNLAVNYRVDPSKSFSIVKNVGTKDEDVLITPAVNEVMKAKATGT